MRGREGTAARRERREDVKRMYDMVGAKPQEEIWTQLFTCEK